VGSGKSWAGSYDLIKRAKPGRLYLVACPTYTMLADSTFRSFQSVAQQLGVLNPRDVKKGQFEVKLRTGAEVIFRSADDPDKLYGPNLSGLWLDEASLMAREVFQVGIGRLREAGEQGWLTSTFTPKGKLHWTFDTFATGRPNTSIHYCRTRDNPFLPAEFHANVAGQYTSQLALQELEGQFVDMEGGLFRRDWFVSVQAAPQIVSRVRAWDLAATPKDERKANDPDYTVGVLMGKDADGIAYIGDVKRLRGSPQQVEAAIRQTALLDGTDTPIWMEQEPGSAGATVIDHYARHVLSGYSFHAERSTGDKATRAQPLAAAAERGLVKLCAGHWNKAFLDEVEVFPYGDHDDQVDACSLAFNKLAAKREFWVHVCDGTPNREYDEAAQRKWAEKLVASGCKRPGGPLPTGGVEMDLRPEAFGWNRMR
jgi:predicted phage terminase large subunit-like protein